MDRIILLLTLNLFLLSLLTMVFLLVLILVLLMFRRTMIRVQEAVDEVETAAMIPLTSMKNIFSDLENFVAAFANMFRLLGKKKKRS